MIKLKYIYFFIIFIFFTNLNADINHFQKGKNLFEEKKYDLAKFKFEQDIVFNPKNENSYLFLAKIYKFKKNDNLEETNLKTVILLNPKNEEAILNLALLKIRKSNYSEAKKLINSFKIVCKTLCQEKSDLQKKLDNILEK
tara:strand:- start:116 stop:538 length:423 start_codon:yes stop_codon:yes gene_type:complete